MDSPGRGKASPTSQSGGESSVERESPPSGNGPLRMGSGIAGLDEILGGGWPANRVHLVLGSPGAGKTTLAIQFLIEGARNGERVLYVTLSETRVELNEVAASHGWTLDGVPI